LLVEKYINGLTSLEEEKELELWVKTSPENMDFFKEQLRLAHHLKEKEPTVFEEEVAFNKIINTTAPQKMILPKGMYKYAAVLVLLISSIVLTKFLLPRIQAPVQNSIVTEYSDPADAITLTLEDGTTSILKENSSETEISKVALSYLNVASENKETLEYHTISIPKGKKMKLLLSDQTIVWLNSESKLRFPKKFLSSEDRRIVFLEGEAFFEVAKDASHPFIVETGGMDVAVLGTKFNVSSYPSETSIKTTLVEGSVQIQEKEGNKSLLKLAPGYQANYRKENGSVQQYEVDVNEYISWMKDRFMFSNERFDAILKRIERTYDVTIINHHNEIDDQRFTGEYDIESIEDIFRTLAISASFEYTINKKQITIRKK